MARYYLIGDYKTNLMKKDGPNLFYLGGNGEWVPDQNLIRFWMGEGEYELFSVEKADKQYRKWFPGKGPMPL